MNVSIVLYHNVTALDAIGPYESLRRVPDVNCSFVGETVEEIRTADKALGMMVDHAFDDVRSTDIVIVPGGSGEGFITAIESKKLHSWLIRQHEKKKWIISVCTGSLILAKAGILKRGMKASTHWRAREALPRFGVTCSGKRITREGKIITSAGVSAGIDMGIVLCELIAGEKTAQAIELSMEYDPEPPFGTGNPDKVGDAIKQAVDDLTI